MTLLGYFTSSNQYCGKLESHIIKWYYNDGQWYGKLQQPETKYVDNQINANAGNNFVPNIIKIRKNRKYQTCVYKSVLVAENKYIQSKLRLNRIELFY